ncbi:MAG: T9SS type A sorting domain-containing protein [Flavobacterium sp.]|nr:MAG: T9SS type A sorting domain-containing protein [Flavobacterium sp.]
MVLLFLIATNTFFAQVFTESNLPIVVITTDIDPNTGEPAEIPDDPKILATMKIIWHTDGSTNYLTDTGTNLNYNGRIGIELRGSSSQDLPKKGYGLTTLQADDTSNNNVSILGMPSENDWILNGLAFDPSLIRDYLSYNLSRQMGNYATRTVYCEVVINGDYRGLYLMQEKIKADGNRVNIVKITNSDIATPNITGGYITKADKTTGGDPIAWQMESYAGTTDFIHELPKPADVTPEQNTYIHNRFNALANAASTDNQSLTFGGYPTIIDVPTFVDFMVSNELASNADGYQLSTFFHKDRGGKLRAGPIWDFNLTYGNDLFQYGFDRSHTDVWQFSDGGNDGAKFWTDLFNNDTFRCYFSRRWYQVTSPGQPLSYDSLIAYIDATIEHIGNAIGRENERWGTIPNHSLEILTLKSWLANRMLWINMNIGPYTACNNIAVPSLVISKINYNPGTFPGFSVGNDLEFIEIKNIGAVAVNLSGIYFKELGISYQFPPTAQVMGNQSVYLASNMATFQQKYGFAAFGQFTRNLSNSSQKLVLADAYGNTIDYVEYKDAFPWPNADGNGMFLQLNNVGLDNNVGFNWTAVSSSQLSTPSFSETGLTVYPNPVSNMLTIKSEEEIEGLMIYNVYGSLLYQSKLKATLLNADFSNYASGVYFVTISNSKGSVTQKVIKQ